MYGAWPFLGKAIKGEMSATHRFAVPARATRRTFTLVEPVRERVNNLSKMDESRMHRPWRGLLSRYLCQKSQGKQLVDINN